MKDLTLQDRLGIALIAFSFLGVLATFVTLGRLAERAQRMDHADRDPTVHGTLRSTVVLLDVTDPLSPEQAAGVAARLKQLEEFELQLGELVTLCTVGRYEDTDVRRWFHARYPGRVANPLFETPRRVAARCDSLFSGPLARALTAAFGPARSNRSAVTAAIQEIAQFDAFGRGIPFRRLILVSDLMENADDLSFYRTPLRSQAAPASAWLEDHRADLRGAAIEVLEVSRPGISVSERAALRGFWRQYFTACGASTVQFGPLG